MPIIRRINTGESNLYSEVRLASLRESPAAFSTTYQTASERSLESWTDQADRSAEGPDRCTFLALDGVNPIGVAALYRDEDRKGVGELIQVWVAPKYRGSGVAGKLVRSIIGWAEDNGILRINTEVLDSNRQVIRFYEGVGFEVSSSMPCHSSSGVVLTQRV